MNIAQLTFMASLRVKFPSPHSGILFLCELQYIHAFIRTEVSVPSFGDSFFISIGSYTLGVRPDFVSVPSFGDSFFIRRRESYTAETIIVSVPSFGDSFFIFPFFEMYTAFRVQGFRPLIRGFFFYVKLLVFLENLICRVSVPSFGDSFFISRSLKTYLNLMLWVSVPSFGDSFFIVPPYIRASFSISFRPLIRGFFFYVGTLGKDTMLPF